LNNSTSKWRFDRRDYELLKIVNDVCCRDQSLEYTRRQYYGYFHPNGIKELAESKSLRIAYAVAHLLSSLEVGGVDDRLTALRSLRDEVLDTAEGPLPKNTARVLLQIMKELVRAHGDYIRQLELAHDFRITASGKPRVVRRQLRRYHLLEMPEEWNQIAFDDHVHDVNTKGRKSSTHLIMDAWIKGIRRLRVVHYNYIEPIFAAELLEAAELMDMDIRIGIEFSARYRDKFVQLIWVPRGFADSQAFLCFLEEPAMIRLMEQGREVSIYQQARVMDMLAAFNRAHLNDVCQRFNIDLSPLAAHEFLEFVGIGQTSTLHLEKFIHQKILEALKANVSASRKEYETADGDRRRAIREWFEEMNRVDLEAVVGELLSSKMNPEVPRPDDPEETEILPSLLRLSPPELLDLLTSLQSGFRVTLNLTNLQIEDVVELLYDSNGIISRLEIFNLKDWASGCTDHIPAINRLQRAINEGSPIALKRVILEVIENLESSELPDRRERIEKLGVILHDLISLRAMYKGGPLKSRIGSDSTGRSPRLHGMGLVVDETLPRRARRRVRADLGAGRDVIPIRITTFRRITLVPPRNGAGSPPNGKETDTGPSWWGYHRRVDWDVQSDDIRLASHGNVITLGGVQKSVPNGIRLKPPRQGSQRSAFSCEYLNSNLKNILKVIIGFIPAFATFALTKDWWLLAYFGAFIWFGITGLRNILQSILGGGGLRRSPLMQWNAVVNWDRIADSLLFTGFSVPLLDYLVKTILLDRGFGITAGSSPILLYTVMALANGVYLSTHNAFRGLPKGAIYGNFFRSVISIPVALLFNAAIAGILSTLGVVGIDSILQKWAAIISKAASDLVAGFIEGTADRYRNIRIRFREYRKKLLELLDIYARLELLFPESQTLDILEEPARVNEAANAEARDLERIIMITALDLLYFWMYQPRARSALLQLIESLSEEERNILITSQFTLLRQREISRMLVDGVIGDDFGRALSFYLARYPEYLEAMKKFA